MIGLAAVALGLMLLFGVPLKGIGIFVLIAGVLAVGKALGHRTQQKKECP